MSKRPPSEIGRYTSIPCRVASQAIAISAIAPFWSVVNIDNES